MTEEPRPPSLDSTTLDSTAPDSTAPDSTALVVVGHGSHLNPRSAEPAHAHADALRDRGIFAEVREAFWKEEPSPREVLRTVERDEAVVVPLFMAAGYFTEQVIPRELRVADGWDLDVEKRVSYAEPVGTHDAMTEVVLERAERVTGDRDLGEGFGLAVVGHGTERNENSARAARRHAARIRDRGRFDEVRALFMDEDPRIADLTDRFGTDDVVVVPLFVADGYHTQEDIPEDVGLTDDHRDGYDVPTEVEGHRVWYAGAVGTEPLLADVIAERARDALSADSAVTDDDSVDSESNSPDVTGDSDRRAFLRWVEAGLLDSGVEEGLDDGGTRAGTRTWGELAVLPDPDADRRADANADGERGYELRHVADREADPSDLEILGRPRDLRDLARFDDEGDFRPLAGAPTLPTGWRLPALDGYELYRAVEFVYPATVANWHRERAGDLDVTHFRATAGRQTGIYERVADLDREAVENAARACCSDETCLKRRAWDHDEGDSLDVPRGDGEFPCREPCSLFVAAAREFERIEREGGESADDELADSEIGDARAGDVSDPANRFRVRYLRARESGEDAGIGPANHNAVAEGSR